MAKRALFHVDAVISMLDDAMNDALSDDEFGGYLSCEEIETCEDLVPCQEIPDQEFNGFTDDFICDEFGALQPTTITQLHPPTFTTQLHPPITTTPTTTSHDTPQGPASGLP